MLIFVLFFLCCTLLCGSVLALNLSQQFQSGSEAVQEEQSCLLARSGWNLALEQMQLSGSTDMIQFTTDSGTVSVEFTESANAIAAWEIEATGTAGEYNRTVSGIVQCIAFPFAHTADWPVLESIHEQTEASILLVADSVYTLQSDCTYPLGIASDDDIPIVVEVTEEMDANALYIHGDLHVSGLLTADCIYITGEIDGMDFIQCDDIYIGADLDTLYQIRVLERNAV